MGRSAGGLVRLVLTLALAQGLAVPAAAQLSGGVISGVVRYEGGAPAVGLTVIVMPEAAQLDAARAMRLVTGAAGDFTLAVPVGTYRVAVVDTQLPGDSPDATLHGRINAAAVPVRVAAPGDAVTLLLTVSAEPGVRRIVDARMSRQETVLEGPARGGAPGRGRGRGPLRPEPGTAAIAGVVMADGEPGPGLSRSPGCRRATTSSA